jgi:hypothetical protein
VQYGCARVSQTGPIDEPLETALAGLRPTLGAPLGDPIVLGGGITNRNFRVRFAPPAGECVVRIPGRDTGLLGIDREAERIANRRAAELRIAPAVRYADDRCLVTAYVPGGDLDGERLRARPERIGRALRCFHDSAVTLPSRFWVPDLLQEYTAVLSGRGVAPGDVYVRTERLVTEIAAALPLRRPVPCHNDLLPGNLMSPTGDAADALLVDWEYAGMGHPWFDLGNLAVNNAFDPEAEDRLLSAYFGGEVPNAGRRAALALFKIVSDAREAAWGVVQGAISALDFDFGDYAERHFTRLLDAADSTRLREWLAIATP